jgi:SWI/SNF-related matrix-associated actin-dependent regulator of chromatin subfamily A member 5
MGLGKTIQTIAFLGYLLEHKNKRGPYLIVGPTTVMGNWMRELKKWLPDLRAVKLLARKEYRYEIFEKYIRPKKFDIIVTSYEGVNICMKELSKINWHYLIVDEAHRLKNENSMFSRNMRKYKKDFILLITGTPIQNNIHELWALLNFIMPDLFDDSEVFDTYTTIEEDISEKERERKNLKYIQSLHRILRPFILKRTKDELSLTLPPKKEIHLFIGLTKLQVELYRKILLKRPLSGEKESYKNVLMQLRKCCDHPYLFNGIEPEDADPIGEHVIEVSSKLTVVDKLLKKLSGGGHQVLIFSQFKITLNVLEDYLNIRGYEYCRFDGDTTLEERELAIDEFTKPNSKKFVFLLSTRAGGLGINLMTADTVVLYDSDWNPQVDLQAMDRAHRIGQKNTVMVYRLICENTVEEKMIERQQIKLKWDQLVILKGKISQKKSKYDKEELKDLISFGANNIFRTEGGTFKDEDIDAILTRGMQKTGELNKKLDKMIEEKREQILNLEVNSINLYEFMGGEMYNKKDREELKVRWDSNKVRTKMGKRVVRYQLDEVEEDGLSQGTEYEKKVIKVHDFQYFNDKERVEELLNKEEDLDEEEKKELKMIESKGFKTWTKNDFFMFVRFLEQSDEVDLKELSENLKKKKNEVHRFYQRFRDEMDSLADKKKLNERFQKAQKQRKFREKVKLVLKEKLMGVEKPEDVTLKSQFYNKIKSKMYRKEHDKFLVFKCHEYGMQSVDKIKKAIRNHRAFRFDIFIKTVKESTLNKRINSLMKMLLNEFNFVEENKQKQIEGGKFSQNCFLMGFKKVYEEGRMIHEKKRKEKLEREKKMAEIEKKRLEEENMLRMELERKKREKLEQKAKLKEQKKLKMAKKASRKIQIEENGNHRKQSIISQISNHEMQQRQMEPKMEMYSSRPMEQIPIHQPRQATYQDTIQLFINESIKSMKDKGFSFMPKQQNFSLEELANKFLQIPDIYQNKELVSILPEPLLIKLLENNGQNFQETMPLVQNHQNYTMSNMTHLNRVSPIKPDNHDIRGYMNPSFRQYPQIPENFNSMQVSKNFGNLENPRNHPSLYVNNINNINNYYMKGYEGKQVYPNDMMFDRHYQRNPMIRDQQMQYMVSRFGYGLTYQRYMPGNLDNEMRFKSMNEAQYHRSRGDMNKYQEGQE